MARLRLGLHHALALGVVLLFVLPFFWAVVASLRAPGLPPPRTIEWWPAAAQWDNYARVFELVPLGRYALNSVIVVATAVPLTLLTASLAGFGMSQLAEPLRTRLLILTIALLMVPAPAVWLLRFQLLRALGLLSSLWALIVPALAATSPLFVLLFYWSFRRVQGELFEAARLDGAGVLTLWWRVALPLAKPAVAGVFVLSFVAYWSDFVSPVLYLYRPETYTLPVGLQLIKQFDATNWPLLMAAAVVMVLPIAGLFLLVQRVFLHERALQHIAEGN